MKIMSYLMLTSILMCGCSHKKDEDVKMANAVSGSSADTLIEAYEYGFPLVLMDVTREITTNVSEPDPERGRAPMNQFVHLKKSPDDTKKDVVRPNLDTLYSAAWLDLSQGAQVLELPDTDDRYYLMPMLDGWTNVYRSPGKRTTGTSAKKFVIVGPNSKEKIAPGLEVIKSPTEMTWILGRTQTNGKEDAKTTVAKIQSGYKLYPLSSMGKTYFPPKPEVNQALSGAVPVDTVFAMSTDEYFNRLNKLMKSNSPAAADAAILEKFKKIGVYPGAKFSSEKLSAEDKMVVAQLPQTMRSKFIKDRDQLGKNVNGWMISRGNGSYGTDYHKRAIIAFAGLGANLDADAVYPNAVFDEFNEKLDGKKNYVLHFDKNELPPVKAFWSLTVYGDDNFLVKNPINRFAIGDRDKLKFNKDGSLDIYIGHRSPGKDKQSNWLPAPSSGSFSVTGRLYWPGEKILNNEWFFPPLVPVSTKDISLND